MTARPIRRVIAAGLTAVALAGVGVGVANAADSTTDPTFGGTFFLADSSSGDPFNVGDPVPLNASVVAVVAQGDFTTKFPTTAGIAAGADDIYTFLAPQGQENNKAAWTAWNSNAGVDPAGLFLPNVSPLAQPTPSGAALSAMTAGGDFSIGWAFTKFGNTVVGSQHFVHIHVAPGGVWSYTQVAAALAATTTTLTAPATAAENAAVSLSAAVAPAAATGSVEYYDGATLLGTSPVGTPFNVAAGFAAGSHSLTAKYLGDASYSPSTSAPSTLSVAGTPVGTTTSVSATSASGYALDPAVLSATVVAANSTTPTGSVTFTGSVDGGAVQNLATVPVGAGGVASITKNGLSAGTWTINASFVGTGLYTNSSSTAAATLVLTVNTTGTSSTDVQDVDVTIPAGAIEITTPYQGGNVFHLGTAVLDQVTSTYSASAPFPNAADAPIKITDTRAGQLGFTAKVTASDFVSTVDATKSFPGSYAGLTGLVATVPSGNGFQIGSLHTTNNPPLAPGLGSAVPFAQYDAGHHPGTVEYRGVLSLAGVPTSVIGGLYTATVTFTAS